MPGTRRTPSNRSMARTSTPSQPASIVGPRLLVIVSTAALALIGLVMVFSASSVTALVETGDPFSDARKQLIFLVAGLVLCALCARVISYHAWKGLFTWVAFGFSALLLLLTAAIGTEGLGAQRWLVIGGVNLQPSEFAKIGILLFAAKSFYDYYQGTISKRTFAIYFGVLHVVVLALILLAQSDMGTTMICIVGIVAIMWLAEVPFRWIGLYTVGVAVVAVAGLSVGYRWERFTSFMDPWADYYGSGYQLIHSFYAFAQGGLFGTGLGNSAEKYQYLPEAHTDFIFAVIGEEMGLVGTVLVVLLFLAFLYGGLRMAQEAPDAFGTILCGSFAVIITFQAFLNIGMSMGLMPITGKPLPFISAGGSSLIASLCMVGLMLSVSYAPQESPVHQQRREDLHLIRSRDAGRAPIPSQTRAGRRGSGPGQTARAGSGASRRTGQRSGSSARSSRR